MAISGDIAGQIDFHEPEIHALVTQNEQKRLEYAMPEKGSCPEIHASFDGMDVPWLSTSIVGAGASRKLVLSMSPSALGLAIGNIAVRCRGGKVLLLIPYRIIVAPHDVRIGHSK